MILISHRGNIDGPLSSKENSPPYINEAILKGFDVELDIWKIKDSLYLGHDTPIYNIDITWLNFYKNKLWIHCKNLEALSYLSQTDLNYFWHQEDNFTLTSHKYIWTYPDNEVTDCSVIVCRDIDSTKKMISSSIYGVCSDYVGFFLQ